MVVVLPVTPLQEAVVGEGEGRCVGDGFGAGELVCGTVVIEGVGWVGVGVADRCAAEWCRAWCPAADAEGDTVAAVVRDGNGGSETTSLPDPPHAASVSAAPTA